ncbi:hypothetical protein [Tenacibaculum amylolyticum]|uniref:hypothetical protein n=1 Tax=Tenacibaculum amylolyticum TaxID=104269 RepID=UPI003894E0F4
MKKILLFIVILLFLFSCNKKPICNINQNNAGYKVYDIDEAICFIALRLDKKAYDINLIRNALIAEENYMSNIGLISVSSNPNNNSNIELHIDKLIEYIVKTEKVDLTKTQLLEIYETEIEYLKFIGVVQEEKTTPKTQIN